MAESRPSRRRYELQLWIDRRVGPLLCAILLGVKRLSRRPRTAPSPDAVRRILLVKFWGMGSIVLASALIGRLRAMYPEARVDFVSLRENEPLLGLAPSIQQAVVKAIPGIRSERGISLIVAEQYARPVMPCVDYGYILENGSMVLEGTGDELLDNPDVKAAYFGM